MAVICAFSGFRFSGKTLTADLVVSKAREYGLTIKKLSFAAPLKQEFCKVKGIGMDSLLLPDVKEQYRREMELFSDACKKEHNNPEYFTDLLFEQILPLDLVIIDDLRLFFTEALRVRAAGGIVWRIHADRQQRINRGMVPNRDADASIYETDMDLSADTYRVLWDTGYIFNNKTMKDLDADVDMLIHRHFLPKFQ